MTPRRIVLVATGGTIASTTAADGITPQLSGSTLLAQLPSLPWHVNDPTVQPPLIEVDDVLTKDSSQFTWDDVVAVTRRVAHHCHSGAEGIVVLHGTDTLETTALWLELWSGAHTAGPTGTGIPIAVTGASFPADDPRTDGPRNLADALTLVLDPTSTPGVHVVCGGAILNPWGVTKVTTDNPVTFHSNCPPETRWQLPLPKEPPPGSSFPHVPIVTVDLGDDGSLLRTVCESQPTSPPAAVIIEALGSGNLSPPPGATRELTQLQKDYPQVLWVVTSRVPQGYVKGMYGGFGGGAQLAESGVIMSGPLRAAQCRALLSAVILCGWNSKAIRQLFQSLLRNEASVLANPTTVKNSLGPAAPPPPQK